MSTHVVRAPAHGYQVAKRVRATKQWMVRSEGNAIGPVSLELLERGLEAGRIPMGAEMSLAGRNQWRHLAEIFPKALTSPLPAALARSLGQEPPVPPAPPSPRYPDEPVSIPTQGFVTSLFG